jgi:putative transposase
MALAWEAPSTTGRPMSQWTSREIAEDITPRGIVDRIAPRHAARL